MYSELPRKTQTFKTVRLASFYPAMKKCIYNGRVEKTQNGRLYSPAATKKKGL